MMHTYKLLKTFTNHKTFHPGVDSKTNKNFAGKRKISSVFLSQNSFSYYNFFQFFVNPENFGNLCMFKKRKSIFAFVLKYQNSLKISPRF